MSITPKMVELARQIVADRDAEKCDPGVPALALAEMVILEAPDADAKPLPCPWCGSESDLYSLEGLVYVVCSNDVNCGVTGPTELTEAAAIAAWNRVVSRCAVREVGTEEEA